MPKNPEIQSRKADHIRINLKEDVQSGLTNGLERYHLVHNALPELDLDEINCHSELFQRKLEVPLLISSMTGGTELAAQINLRLAEAAQKFGLALGVGSQRVGLESPELMGTFKVRKAAPDILLFANLGAVQLNYSYSIEHCKAAVDAIQADALILHLNPMQEALMENGNTRFGGLLAKIANVCRGLSVPVVVKEVGWGISGDVAKKLHEAGVAGIDVAGAGGTSWSEVEKHRSRLDSARQTAAGFRNWGIPTADALIDIHRELPEVILVASGGIQGGVEACKCLAMGARLVGVARPFLKAAAESTDELHTRIAVMKQQIRVGMFCAGARNLTELRSGKIIENLR